MGHHTTSEVIAAFGYWDIMVRDVALFLLALTFARLARAFPAGAVTDRLMANRRRARTIRST